MQFVDSCMSDILYHQTSPLPICLAISKMSALSKIHHLKALVYHLLPPSSQQVITSLNIAAVSVRGKNFKNICLCKLDPPFI